MDQQAVDTLKAQISLLQNEIERMRKAIEAFVHYDTAQDVDGFTLMRNYDSAITLARKALEETK